MKNKISQEQSRIQLESNYAKAEEMLNDTDKLEHLLNQLEEKLKIIPIIGNELAYVPIMISMVRSYIKGEYKEAPLGSIIAIISGLIYLANPIDLIPDAIPALGLTDDAAVIALCFKLVSSDLNDYKTWKETK